MSAVLEVLVDGVWMPAPSMQSPTWEPLPDEPLVAEVVTEAEAWSMEMEFVGGGDGLVAAIKRAERLAFEKRCAARMWLTHPYRMEGVH